MKHPNIMIGKMGHAKRNRGTGILDWAFLAKIFPDWREHIYRIRNDQNRLLVLRNRLAKWGIVGNIVYKQEVK